MKISPFSALLVVATSISAVAAEQSGPFKLKLVNSENETLNGQSLYACHAGAAIEGLCLGSGARRSNRFFLNSTIGSTSKGKLIYNFPLGKKGNHTSEPLSFHYQATSNVANPMFTPWEDSGVDVVFTEDNKLTIPYWYDDSKFVPGSKPPEDSTKGSYTSNWHICYDMFNTYYYEALCWVTSGEPHNPTCQAVEVVREFV